MTVLQLVLTALAAVVVAWLLVLIARDRRPGDALYAAVGLLEVGLLVELVWGLARLTGSHPGVNVPAYAGYLVGSVLILPAAFLWSLGEKTRAGTGVLLVGVLVVPVLFLRLHQLWSPA